MDLSAFDLKGKVALITGGAHGIGFSIAEGMDKCGAAICFNCSSEVSLEKGLAAYKAVGIDAHGYVADVTDEAAVNAMIAQIKADVGPVDILVNNVGISHFKPLTELSIKEFDRLMATNLRPVFITSRQLALHRQQNGNQQCDCIINLCSTRYLHSEAGTEAYSASKGETSIIHDGLTAEDLRFIPVLFPKSALGTVSSPLYAGRRTSGNGACYSTRF